MKSRSTRPSTQNRVKGGARQVKGRVKEATGKAVGNRRLQAKGKVEANVGKAQRGVGRVQRRAERDLD
jgi:uncharacterized protein YjbJ (UPF0337 family)